MKLSESIGLDIKNNQSKIYEFNFSIAKKVLIFDWVNQIQRQDQDIIFQQGYAPSISAR